MNKTFIFQKVFGSYEVVVWIVVADSMEEAFQAMRNYIHETYKGLSEKDYEFHYTHTIDHQTPMAKGSLINGVNYDPKTDIIKVDYLSYYHSASGTYKKTHAEGWWDYKEFNSDLPKGYILYEAHDG